ncbi:MAG: Gfo/Idh/MocA family protein [Halobacteriales archaeon]
MAYRMIQVGTGGRGRTWCRSILPPNVEDGLIEPVAAVDLDPDAHENAIEGLGLDPGQCYTDMEEALEAVEADIVGNVTPPHVHEDVVEAALAHDMDIISEKPIADTLEASARIVKKVEDADAKMGVTMSHRFRDDVTTLRRQVRSGEHGPLDYLYGRYAVNARSYGWGDRLYEWDEHPLLIDGSVHHLDLLADLAGGEPEEIYAHTWNPEWSEFDGDPNAVVHLKCDDGTHVTYEGSNTNAVSTGGWGNEHVRAECRDATLMLDGHEIAAFPYDEDGENCTGNARFSDGEAIPLDEQEKWSDPWLVEQFVEWLDGGEPMETNVEDNLVSMALVFGAIESAETGEPVNVGDLLAEARAEVGLD